MYFITDVSIVIINCHKMSFHLTFLIQYKVVSHLFYYIPIFQSFIPVHNLLKYIVMCQSDIVLSCVFLKVKNGVRKSCCVFLKGSPQLFLTAVI